MSWPSELMYDSFWGVIAIHVAFQTGFCVFVLSNYMETVPMALVEASIVDGAGVWRQYWQVILPFRAAQHRTRRTAETARTMVHRHPSPESRGRAQHRPRVRITPRPGIRSAGSAPHPAGRLDPGLVHGDFSPTNVLVDTCGRITGVIDWEAVKSGPPEMDVGWWDCFFDTPAAPTASLVAGYERLASFDPARLAALRHLTVVRVMIGTWC